MLTVDDYLAKLAPDRRDAISRVRAVINAQLPRGFEEKLQYGMISWCVPESVLPAKETYNKQQLCLVSLGSQKRHMAIYLMSVYGSPRERAWFERAYKASGKKLDMGQSCVRFTSIDALPLDVIGEAVSRVDVDAYVAEYKRLHDAHRAKRKNGAAKPARKPAKTPPKQPAKKRANPR